MLPKEGYDEMDEELETGFTLESEPYLTYAMKISDKPEQGGCIFFGKVDDENAIRQAIMKVLNTERYEHEIYSWDYGIELQDLYGMPIPYVMSEIQYRIEDALLVDDRIESVDDFEVKRVGKRTIHCTFAVMTAQGEEIKEEKEIEL